MNGILVLCLVVVSLAALAQARSTQDIALQNLLRALTAKDDGRPGAQIAARGRQASARGQGVVARDRDGIEARGALAGTHIAARGRPASTIRQNADTSCYSQCDTIRSDCYCDSVCPLWNDCCADYYAQCTLSGSCSGNCGYLSADGCFCDDLCSYFGDCCTDYASLCL